MQQVEIRNDLDSQALANSMTSFLSFVSQKIFVVKTTDQFKQKSLILAQIER